MTDLLLGAATPAFIVALVAWRSVYGSQRRFARWALGSFACSGALWLSVGGQDALLVDVSGLFALAGMLMAAAMLLTENAFRSRKLQEALHRA